jgi:hypothetical protein
MRLRSIDFLGLSLAQGPPPPPALSGSNTSISGAISQLNYGPEMEVTSFLVNQNTLVTFPPHVGVAIGAALKPGENVQVTGYGFTARTAVPPRHLSTSLYCEIG